MPVTIHSTPTMIPPRMAPISPRRAPQRIVLLDEGALQREVHRQTQFRKEKTRQRHQHYRQDDDTVVDDKKKLRKRLLGASRSKKETPPSRLDRQQPHENSEPESGAVWKTIEKNDGISRRKRRPQERLQNNESVQTSTREPPHRKGERRRSSSSQKQAVPATVLIAHDSNHSAATAVTEKETVLTSQSNNNIATGKRRKKPFPLPRAPRKSGQPAPPATATRQTQQPLNSASQLSSMSSRSGGSLQKKRRRPSSQKKAASRPVAAKGISQEKPSQKPTTCAPPPPPAATTAPTKPTPTAGPPASSEASKKSFLEKQALVASVFQQQAPRNTSNPRPEPINSPRRNRELSSDFMVKQVMLANVLNRPLPVTGEESAPRPPPSPPKKSQAMAQKGLALEAILNKGPPLRALAPPPPTVILDDTENLAPISPRRGPSPIAAAAAAAAAKRASRAPKSKQVATGRPPADRLRAAPNTRNPQRQVASTTPTMVHPNGTKKNKKTRKKKKRVANEPTRGPKPTPSATRPPQTSTSEQNPRRQPAQSNNIGILKQTPPSNNPIRTTPPPQRTETPTLNSTALLPDRNIASSVQGNIPPIFSKSQQQATQQERIQAKEDKSRFPQPWKKNPLQTPPSPQSPAAKKREEDVRATLGARKPIRRGRKPTKQNGIELTPPLAHSSYRPGLSPGARSEYTEEYTEVSLPRSEGASSFIEIPVTPGATDRYHGAARVTITPGGTQEIILDEDGDNEYIEEAVTPTPYRGPRNAAIRRQTNALPAAPLSTSPHASVGAKADDSSYMEIPVTPGVSEQYARAGTLTVTPGGTQEILLPMDDNNVKGEYFEEVELTPSPRQGPRGAVGGPKRGLPQAPLSDGTNNTAPSNAAAHKPRRGKRLPKAFYKGSAETQPQHQSTKNQTTASYPPNPNLEADESSYMEIPMTPGVTGQYAGLGTLTITPGGTQEILLPMDDDDYEEVSYQSPQKTPRGMPRVPISTNPTADDEYYEEVVVTPSPQKAPRNAAMRTGALPSAPLSDSPTKTPTKVGPNGIILPASPRRKKLPKAFYRHSPIKQEPPKRAPKLERKVSARLLQYQKAVEKPKESNQKPASDVKTPGKLRLAQYQAALANKTPDPKPESDPPQPKARGRLAANPFLQQYQQAAAASQAKLTTTTISKEEIPASSKATALLERYEKAVEPKPQSTPLEYTPMRVSIPGEPKVVPNYISSRRLNVPEALQNEKYKTNMAGEIEQAVQVDDHSVSANHEVEAPPPVPVQTTHSAMRSVPPPPEKPFDESTVEPIVAFFYRNAMAHKELKPYFRQVTAQQLKDEFFKLAQIDHSQIRDYCQDFVQFDFILDGIDAEVMICLWQVAYESRWVDDDEAGAQFLVGPSRAITNLRAMQLLCKTDSDFRNLSEERKQQPKTGKRQRGWFLCCCFRK